MTPWLGDRLGGEEQVNGLATEGVGLGRLLPLLRSSAQLPQLRELTMRLRLNQQATSGMRCDTRPCASSRSASWPVRA